MAISAIMVAVIVVVVQTMTPSTLGHVQGKVLYTHSPSLAKHPYRHHPRRHTTLSQNGRTDKYMYKLLGKLFGTRVDGCRRESESVADWQ